jgi:hypothetical protein
MEKNTMTRTEMKKNKRIVSDMKECFRSLHLPVYKAEKDDHYDFESKIDNDHLVAKVLVECDWDRGYVTINVVFCVISLENIAKASRMMNLLNGITPFFHYSICPCCNEIAAHSRLSIPGKLFSKERFTWLLRYLLENIYLGFPCIAAAVFNCGDPMKFYDQFIAARRNSTPENSLSDDLKEKVLSDLMSVLTDFYPAITDNNRVENAFIFKSVDPSDQELSFLNRAEVDTINRAVILSASLDFTFPDEKLMAVMELVNRLNQLCGDQHLHIDHEESRIVFLMGIPLNDGALPKEELHKAFEMMIINALVWFRIFKLLLTSGETPTELIRKGVPC